jgi:hypothetical protein
VNGDLGILITALIALVLMTLLMRWVFRPNAHRRRAVIPGDAVPGLLTPLAAGLTRANGLALRANLGDANIRSSISARRDGRVDVMVFTEDYERARMVLPPGSP